MVSGIPTASGYEERIQFSEMEVVDRGANENGILANVPEGHAIHGWDVNVAAVRVRSLRRTVRHHQHAVSHGCTSGMGWWLTVSRNSSFASTAKGSPICSLAGDMAISRSFINNCRLSSQENRSRHSHGRTRRLQRRVGGVRRRRMTMCLLSHRFLRRR